MGACEVGQAERLLTSRYSKDQEIAADWPLQQRNPQRGIYKRQLVRKNETQSYGPSRQCSHASLRKGKPGAISGRKATGLLSS